MASVTAATQLTDAMLRFGGITPLAGPLPFKGRDRGEAGVSCGMPHAG